MKYVNAKQLGEMLGWHEKTIRRKAIKKQIPGVYKERRWKFDPIRVQSSLEKQLNTKI